MNKCRLCSQTTFDWTQIQNFQVVATSNSIDALDPRLVSLSHIVSFTAPSLDEQQSIVEGLCPDNVNWRSAFAKGFTRVASEMASSKEGDSRLVAGCVRYASQAISSLKRCEEVDGSVLNTETVRALAGHCREVSAARLAGAAMSAYGSADLDKILKAQAFGAKVSFSSRAQFAEWLTKSIKLWISETEAYLPEIALIDETVQLFSEVALFLSNSEPGVRSLVLLGQSGCGRKLALRVLSHVFGYDVIWSPKAKLTDKQLSAEIKAIAEDDTNSDKKVLFILDRIHFETLPFMRKFVYTFAREYAGEGVIRVAVVTSELDDVSELIWDRAGRIYNASPFSEGSLEQLPTLLSSNEIDRSFAKNFPKVLRLFPQFEADARRYLAFVNQYMNLINAKKSMFDQRRQTLTVGVKKLEEASTEVETLKVRHRECLKEGKRLLTRGRCYDSLRTRPASKRRSWRRSGRRRTTRSP